MKNPDFSDCHKAVEALMSMFDAAYIADKVDNVIESVCTSGLMVEHELTEEISVLFNLKRMARALERPRI